MLLIINAMVVMLLIFSLVSSCNINVNVYHLWLLCPLHPYSDFQAYNALHYYKKGIICGRHTAKSICSHIS